MTQDGLQTTAPEMTAFLMIGQSNMAGRGEFADVEPIRNPLCHMLRNGRWQHMSEPVNPDRPIFEGKYHSGVSLAASFADSFAAETGRKVGLIPCADGGTAIAQWQPGEVLYDHAVAQTGFALRSATLGGILWHQGEADCKPDRFPPYRERFIHMMTTLRRTLGAEELPLLIGELSTTMTVEIGRSGYPEKLNALFHEIARELPCCAVVSSADLTMKPDGLHFDARACREFGRRYYAAYRALVG